MTPSALLMPATPPANTSVTKESKSYQYEDNVRSKRSADINYSKKSAGTAEIKTKDESKEASSTDLTLFEQMMASLLNTSPVQTQATVTVKPTGNEAVASSQFGSAFNMEPALLVIPQDIAGASALTANNADGSSFNAELLAALTPGIPAPVTDQTALMSEIEVAANAAVSVLVPAIPAESVTTPALTVDNDVSADPRLVACGIDPVQMEELKAKLAALPATSQTPTTAPSQTSSSGAPISAVATSNVTTDSGIISVAFTMPKPQSTTTNSQIQPVPVQTNVQVQAPVIPAPVETVAATVKAIETALPLSVAADAAIKADAASSKIQDGTAAQTIISGEDNFDPVEFRIAQSFSQRPVATNTPASPATAPVDPNTNPSGVAGNTPPQSNPAQANTSIHGKANLPSADTANSLLSALPSFDALTGEINLTASPAALPVTVSPLTSTVIHSTNAAQSHPAIHAAAAVIAKNAKEGGPQTISMRLDPPELGKLQVEMKYKKGDPLKVHVVLEKADTASMFMRDAHALESTLKEAGLQLDGSSLSFEFSGDGSFQQALKGDGSSNGSASAGLSGNVTEDLPTLDVTPDIYTDAKTGLTHYSLKA